jgi:hypothetical protein
MFALLPYIVHLPIIFTISFLIKKKNCEQPLNSLFWPGLLIKAFSGILLGLLYLNYYPSGDTLYFQEYSKILTDYFLNEPQNFFSTILKDEYDEKLKQMIVFWEEERSMVMVKILAILNLFTFKNYWVNSLYFSLFSFIPIWLLGNYLGRKFNISKYSIALSFLLFPSFVFWSSGVLKDTLVTGCICFILLYFLKLKLEPEKNLKHLFFIFLFLYLCYQIKFYYAVILGLTGLSYLITDFIIAKLYIKGNYSFILILPIILFTLIIVGSFIFPSLDIDYILFIMHHSYTTIISQGGDFAFSDLRPELTSYVKNIPAALYIGLFRPLPWDTSEILPFITGLENLGLLTLFISLIYSLLKKKKNIFSPEGYSLLFYVLISASLMGFIAPNWGTLARYKSGYLMFWVLLLSQNNLLFESVVKKVQKIFASFTKLSKNNI